MSLEFEIQDGRGRNLSLENHNGEVGIYSGHHRRTFYIPLSSKEARRMAKGLVILADQIDRKGSNWFIDSLGIGVKKLDTRPITNYLTRGIGDLPDNPGD